MMGFLTEVKKVLGKTNDLGFNVIATDNNKEELRPVLMEYIEDINKKLPKRAKERALLTAKKMRISPSRIPDLHIQLSVSELNNGFRVHLPIIKYNRVFKGLMNMSINDMKVITRQYLLDEKGLQNVKVN